MFFQKNKNLASGLPLLLLLATLFVACVKTDFDDPPVGGDGQDIPTNTTIRDLKKLALNFTGNLLRISEDLVIGGTVVMDDRSGNYYKALVIQDSTGGIEVKFNDGYLYNRYPVGRKIYIRCKDLILTDYNGLIQLTGGIVQEGSGFTGIGITELQEREKIVKGFLGAPPTPRTVGIADLTLDMVSTLIRLEGVQFAMCDAAKTYAEPISKTDLNRSLEDCGGREVYLRSSGFADFAGEKTSFKNGSLVGVLGFYSTNSQVDAWDFQLYVRDLNDVNMTADRCGTIGGTLTNISEIRSAFSGTTTTVQGSKKIKGIVISDRSTNNLNARNLFLQDGTAGIVVRFGSGQEHCFDLGDEIEVEVSGQELSEFNKLLQVNNVPLSNAIVISSGKSVAPREVASVAELNTNYEAWESTLVRIKNVTITGGSPNHTGGHTVTDASGSIAIFTQTFATFANTPLPTGQVTLTAIVSDFNGKQVILRNLGDVQQ